MSKCNRSNKRISLRETDKKKNRFYPVSHKTTRLGNRMITPKDKYVFSSVFPSEEVMKKVYLIMQDNE